MNVLIVAAHPDDEVLGCGATIAKLVKENHSVYAAILGEGITSRFEDHKSADRSLIETLRQECLESSRILGLKEVFFYDFPDNSFDTVPLLSIIKTIEGLIERLKPEVIYTHHSSDLNIDHSLTNRAVLTATRPLPGRFVLEIYAFEVPSSTEWSFQLSGKAFEPNVFMDVSDYLEMKIQALAQYKSEIPNYPHPRSLESIRHLASHWGTVIGRDAAEAFQLVRMIR